MRSTSHRIVGAAFGAQGTLIALGVSLVALVLALPATAAPVTEWDSSTVAVPGLIIPIGGAGQVNGNFVVADDPVSGAQIALRANRRFSPVPLPIAGNVYSIEPGESAPGLPLWNYDVHIDLRGTGFSFDDFVISLVTDVANHSTPNLQGTLESALALPSGVLSNVVLFQTSQNPGFFASGIDPFQPGTYNFRLDLTPRAGSQATALSVAMAVNVVPTPSALSGGAFLFLWLSLANRRRPLRSA